MTNLIEMGIKAKKSAAILATASTGDKNRALYAIADGLEVESHIADILKANTIDMEHAVENGMSLAKQDRLKLTKERIFDIADAVRYVAGLEDPVGRVIGGDTRPNGLQITKKTVPLGVIGIIYESRPNVSVDSAAICLKSGNACILRGGSDAINSNMALAAVMRNTIASIGMDADCVQLVEDTSRDIAMAMMKLNGYIDVLIPRGTAGLIATVVQNSTVPIIKTGSGNCHVFIDESADPVMAVNIINNAKTSRPGVCNAAETLLIHRACADNLLPIIADKLEKSSVELRGCPETMRILGDKAIPATDEDWATEYEDYILAIKVVSGLDEALSHISAYSTNHSEAIVTSDYANSIRFTNEVDSAAVYVNASTRFTDGGEFGLGAEIGISSQKLHARGPMGLAHMTSYKYIINGNGQIR